MHWAGHLQVVTAARCGRPLDGRVQLLRRHRLRLQHLPVNGTQRSGSSSTIRVWDNLSCRSLLQYYSICKRIRILRKETTLACFRFQYTIYVYTRAHSHTDTKSQTHSYRHACTHNNDDHHPRHRHGQITCMTVLTIFGVSFGVLMISSVSDFADFFSIFLAFSLSSFLKEWMEFIHGAINSGTFVSLSS